MRKLAGSWAIALGLLGMSLAAPALGDVTVSITLNGSIDEILPLLEHLRDMGIGAQAQEERDAVMNLYSTIHATPEGELVVGTSPVEAVPQAEAAPEAPAPPEPKLGLADAQAAPSTIPSGETTLLTVAVSDPDHVVDTMAAANAATGLSVDLYDNGSMGDVTPNDGIWSRSVSLTAAPGDYMVTITAYNANGEPVLVEGENGPSEPLTATARVRIAE
jgi:hypothetical protein